MIGEVSRGGDMPNLIGYLFSPGRHNEHVNQHLVAGYADAVFTADDKLWQNEPGILRQLRKEARDLGWQIDYPRSRWRPDDTIAHVWHCSVSIRADEGELTDAQWTEAAHAIVDKLGFSNSAGKSPCRWAAVRHGPSTNGNDHVHIALSLVREDGTRASTWNDYRKVAQACHDLEQRFGLGHVPGRTAGSLREPSRQDREISAARGEPEPLRIRLERTVRACAAAAYSENHFVELVQANGLLIRPHCQGTKVTGYAVAEKNGRLAYSRKTGITGPIWFGGGKLATDLSLPRLRERWNRSGSPQASMTAGDGVAVAADLMAIAATTCERGSPGALSQAARHLARAAQHHPGARRPEVVAVIRDMASTFTAITRRSHAEAALALVTEVARLVDTYAALRGATTDIRQASTLIQASLTDLARAATRQAAAVLPAPRKEVSMTDPTHEEEFLAHITQAGLLTVKILQVLQGAAPGSTDTDQLKAAGYRAETQYDAHLRAVLGKRRWEKYEQDPARIVCAAVISDGASAGYDMRAVITKVFAQRPWEDDPISSARSIARTMAYRIARELADPGARRTYAYPLAGQEGRTSIASSPAPIPPASSRTEPMPVSPYDDHLRALLGENRWAQYEHDERRRDIATLLSDAGAQGHDVTALLNEAFESRKWEDDERSPARRFGGVLHYRVRALIATGRFLTTSELPGTVAQTVSRAGAPTAKGHGSRKPTEPGRVARTSRQQTVAQRD